MNPVPAPRRPRSAFVTSVAWVFIVLAGFATLIAVMQATMFAFLFSAGGAVPFADAAREARQLPAPMRLLLENVWVIFAAFWAAAIVTLIAAIGLLRRRNWARVLFIALMALGIAWNAAGLWLQQQIMASMPKAPPHASAEIAAGFDTMATVMGIGMAAFAVVIAAVFGWIAVRLMSRAVKSEFGAR